MPSLIAAFVAQIASSTLSAFSFNSISELAPTFTTATFADSLASLFSSLITSPGFFSTSTSVYVSGQPIIFSEIGRYSMTTNLQKPTPGFFNSILGATWETVDSTTTVFTLATATPAQQAAAAGAVAQAARCSIATSTSYSIWSCVNDGISSCVAQLFVPCDSSFQQFDDIDITKKPPLGYFTSVSGVFATSSSATTTPVALVGAAFVSTSLGSLIAGLGDIVLLVVAIWIFVRIAYWDWHQ